MAEGAKDAVSMKDIEKETPTSPNVVSNESIQDDNSLILSFPRKILLSTILFILLPFDPLFYICSKIYSSVPNLSCFKSSRNPKKGGYSMICSIVIALTTIFIWIYLRYTPFLLKYFPQALVTFMFIFSILSMTASFTTFAILIGYDPIQEGGKCPAICRSIQICLFIAFFVPLLIIILSVYGIMCFIVYGCLYPNHFLHELIVFLWQLILIENECCPCCCKKISIDANDIDNIEYGYNQKQLEGQLEMHNNVNNQVSNDRKQAEGV